MLYVNHAQIISCAHIICRGRGRLYKYVRLQVASSVNTTAWNLDGAHKRCLNAVVHPVTIPLCKCSRHTHVEVEQDIPHATSSHP